MQHMFPGTQNHVINPAKQTLKLIVAIATASLVAFNPAYVIINIT